MAVIVEPLWQCSGLTTPDSTLGTICGAGDSGQLFEEEVVLSVKGCKDLRGKKLK